MAAMGLWRLSESDERFVIDPDGSHNSEIGSAEESEEYIELSNR